MDRLKMFCNKIPQEIKVASKMDTSGAPGRVVFGVRPAIIDLRMQMQVF
jgi:hypothetical protein